MHSASDNPPPATDRLTDEVDETADKPCCCRTIGAKPSEIVQTPPSTVKPWVVGTFDAPAGVVPQVSTELQLADHLGAWRVRWGIGRMRYPADASRSPVR